MAGVACADFGTMTGRELIISTQAMSSHFLIN
jgi:hypothetical protein